MSRWRNCSKAIEIQKWFSETVVYEGKPYTIDLEQAEAVVDESLNAIVVARAGSGKTRTLVAKIVYLVARCGVKPSEIMAFVFNANAAKEINTRLAKMMVNGEPVVKNSKIASTFHAFSRSIVYDACGGRDKCGRILANKKDEFVLELVRRMMRDEKLGGKIKRFIESESINGEGIEEEELIRFAEKMSQFINRAQQRYLGGEITLKESAKNYLINNDVKEKERIFVELGVECYRRYYWYLLESKRKLKGFEEYGTDFNLIVSWASKLIKAKRGKVRRLLANKKYILIDEYQDFSQLFLAAVQAIRGVTNEARIFVVGDDWQAINRFAGSDVEYFKRFENCFPEDCKRLTISTNYRCDYLVVNTARKFMKKAMKEKGDFRAFSRKAGRVVLVDPSKTEYEYAMTDYDKRVSGQGKIYKEMARRMVGRSPKRKTVQYVKTIVEIICKNRKFDEILILYRNNETNIEGISLKKLSQGLKWGLKQIDVMDYEEYDAKIRVMTMHKSKGLESEVVIILEADEGVIPKSHPDTLLYRVFGETNEVALKDQMRLFYVAMTRAKNRLYIMHNKTNQRKTEGFIPYLGRGVEHWEN